MKLNGAALTGFRSLAGLTQLALAAKSGVSQGRISELEKGDKDGAPLDVRPTTAKALADAVGQPVAALVMFESTEAA